MKASSLGMEPSSSTTGPPSSYVSKNLGELKGHRNPFSFGTIVKLDETNYSRWFLTFILAIIAHRKAHIVLKSISLDMTGDIVHGRTMIAWLVLGF